MALCGTLLNFVRVRAALFLVSAFVFVGLHTRRHDSAVIGVMDNSVAPVSLDECVFLRSRVIAAFRAL